MSNPTVNAERAIPLEASSEKFSGRGMSQQDAANLLNRISLPGERPYPQDSWGEGQLQARAARLKWGPQHSGISLKSATSWARDYVLAPQIYLLDGMVVQQATDARNRTVVVKLAKQKDSPEIVRWEAEALLRVRHHNIDNKLPFTAAGKVKCYQSLLSAVMYLQRHSIAHTRLTPRSILLYYRGLVPHIKITDFEEWGAIRPVPVLREAASSSRLNHSSADILSTSWEREHFVYLPPEKLLYRLPWGATIYTDVWSCGMILWDLFLEPYCYNHDLENDGMYSARKLSNCLAFLIPMQLDRLKPQSYSVQLVIHQAVKRMLMVHPDERCTFQDVVDLMSRLRIDERIPDSRDVDGTGAPYDTLTVVGPQTFEEMGLRMGHGDEECLVM